MVFTSAFKRTVLYVDSQGPVPLSVTVAILSVSGLAKGDDLKQIVQLPALILSVSAGFTLLL